MMVTPPGNVAVKLLVLLRKLPRPGSIPGAAYATLLPVVLLVALVGSVVGGLMLLTHHSGTPADWSIYVASSADGISKFDARTHALQWKTQDNGSITISQNIIYSAHGSVLRALNAGDGSLRWSYVIASPGIITTLPVVSDEQVYIATTLGSGSIYALSAASGRPLWRTPLAAENLIAANGMLYVNTDLSFNEPAPTNDLYALDARTGLALWHIRAPVGEVFGSPQIADGTLFIVSYIPDQGGSVYAFNSRTGAELWHSQAVVGLFSSAPPVAAEGRIYFAPTNTGSLYALDAANGAEVWHYQAALEGEEFHVPPEVSNGVAYFWGKSDRQHQNFVLALAASTGTVRWRYWGLYLHDALAVQEGQVYISSKDGILHALQAADGTELWQRPYIQGATPSTRVVVDSAMVVVGP